MVLIQKGLFCNNEMIDSQFMIIYVLFVINWSCPLRSKYGETPTSYKPCKFWLIIDNTDLIRNAYT